MPTDVFSTPAALDFDYHQGDGVEYLVPGRFHDGRQVYGQAVDRTFPAANVNVIASNIIHEVVECHIPMNGSQVGTTRYGEWYWNNHLANPTNNYAWMKHDNPGNPLSCNRYNGGFLWGGRHHYGFVLYTKV